MEAVGFGKGPQKKPFGSDLADKRLLENRVLRHGKSKVYSSEEIVRYVSSKLEDKSMAIGRLKVIEKETLLKRVAKDGVILDIFDTKVCVHYSTDRSRVFEVSMEDLISQAVEVLGTLPPPKEPMAERRAYTKPPEECTSWDSAATKLDITPAKLDLLIPEMKGFGYTVNPVEENGKKFMRKVDLERMLVVKPRLIDFLRKKREERSK